ncbi:MAG: hypothetical protein QXG65_05185 [Thermoplasmata archaeon]
MGSARAWSANRERREAFRRWAQQDLGVGVRLGTDAGDVLRRAPVVALLPSSETPAGTPEMIPGPVLRVRISSYRRPEIDRRFLAPAPRVRTESIGWATGPGPLFEGGAMGEKVRGPADPEGGSDLRDASMTRIVIPTGAAREELLLAESLWRSAEASDVGLDVTLASVC